MKTAVDKAKVLLEALPYIQAFHGKVFVIKYGGSSLEDASIRRSVLQDIVFMHYVGIRPVLVHGGGPSINKALRAKGIVPEFVNGLRKTNSRVLKVVVRELKKINAQIVRELRELRCPALGLIDKDAVIKARQRSEELGYVGEIIGINANPIFSLLSKGIIPVIAPFGVDRKGKLYNVNADLSAAEISVALGVEKLVFLTNVDGIMYKDRLLSSVDANRIRRFVSTGVISGGMLPKVEAGLSALERGVKKVHVVNAKHKHALLLEIFTKKGVGTEIKVD